MKRLLLAIIVCGLGIYFRDPLKELANEFLKDFNKSSPSTNSASQQVKPTKAPQTPSKYTLEKTPESSPETLSETQSETPSKSTFEKPPETPTETQSEPPSVAAVPSSETAEPAHPLQCYVGFVEIDKPMSLTVRKTTCEDSQTSCTTMKVTDEYNGTQTDTIIGGCGSFISEYQCEMLGSSFPLRKKCQVTMCEGHFCNSEVFEASEKERIKSENEPGKRLRCNTGQLMDLPSIAPKSDIDKQVDECPPSTKECATLVYDLQVHFMGSFSYRTAMGICKDPSVKCEDYCEKTRKFMTIANCKASCCSTDECNPLVLIE